MKRPLLFLLGVWIVGEWAVFLAGLPLRPAMPLDGWMRGKESAAVLVRGRVRQIRRTSSGISYILGDAAAEAGGETLRTRSVLVFSDGAADLAIGMTVEAAGNLSPFPVPGNPGEFDLRSYYQALGIDWRLTEEKRRVTLRKTQPCLQGLYLLRECLADSLERLTAPGEAAVLEAVLLGDRSGLSRELRDDYRDASLSHLLSISGLHISLLGMGLFRWLRKRSSPLPLQYLLSAFIVFSYVLMTGAAPSSLRAAVMFFLYLGALLTGRSYDALSAMSTAALLLLFAHPLLLFQSYFQLSFLAVFAVTGMWPAVSGWLGKMPAAAESFGLSLVLQWAVWPVTAIMNGMIPVYGLLVNLLVLPLAAPLLLFAGAGAGSEALGFAAGRFLVQPARWILTWINMLAEGVQVLPGHSLVTGCPERWQILCYLLVVSAVFLMIRGAGEREKRRKEQAKRKKKRGRQWRRCTLLLAVSFFLPLLLIRPPVRGLQITCVDVGQGDCILIRGPEFAFLVDAGSSQVEDVGRRRILPYLHSQGIARLDGLLLTHGDSDHYSGMPVLLADSSLKVTALLLSEPEAEDEELRGLFALAGAEEVPVRILGEGDAWQWGEVRFHCLCPGEKDAVRYAENKNEGSVVLMVEGEGIRTLLTGDLGEEGEKALLAKGVNLDVDILKVGHHGSKYSSTEDFLRAVSPELALISAGKNNLYGHPSPETLARLSEAGSRSLCTADGGALTLLAKEGKWQAACYLSLTLDQAEETERTAVIPRLPPPPPKAGTAADRCRGHGW